MQELGATLKYIPRYRNRKLLCYIYLLISWTVYGGHIIASKFPDSVYVYEYIVQL